jgi:hypothetical protein
MRTGQELPGAIPRIATARRLIHSSGAVQTWWLLIHLTLCACTRTHRCGWDCEADGYDDDSNPLPQYKARYDAITALLREGRTPDYKGKLPTATAPGSKGR